jgi:hypothetical protein
VLTRSGKNEKGFGLSGKVTFQPDFQPGADRSGLAVVPNADFARLFDLFQ